jgi:hypothetical protein
VSLQLSKQLAIFFFKSAKSKKCQLDFNRQLDHLGMGLDKKSLSFMATEGNTISLKARSKQLLRRCIRKLKLPSLMGTV